MTATSPHRGFLLRADGVYTAFDFPGATTTALYGINPRGEIAGMYTLADGSRHTFLSRGGRLTKIDYPGASATGTFGITPQGEVYGVYVLNGAGHGYSIRQAAGSQRLTIPARLLPTLPAGTPPVISRDTGSIRRESATVTSSRMVSSPASIIQARPSRHCRPSIRRETSPAAARSTS
jgi:hypothetical protein